MPTTSGSCTAPRGRCPGPWRRPRGTTCTRNSGPGNCDSRKTTWASRRPCAWKPPAAWAGRLLTSPSPPPPPRAWSPWPRASGGAGGTRWSRPWGNSPATSGPGRPWRAGASLSGKCPCGRATAPGPKPGPPSRPGRVATRKRVCWTPWAPPRGSWPCPGCGSRMGSSWTWPPWAWRAAPGACTWWSMASRGPEPRCRTFKASAPSPREVTRGCWRPRARASSGPTRPSGSHSPPWAPGSRWKTGPISAGLPRTISAPGWRMAAAWKPGPPISSPVSAPWKPSPP